MEISQVSGQTSTQTLSNYRWPTCIKVKPEERTTRRFHRGGSGYQEDVMHRSLTGICGSIIRNVFCSTRSVLGGYPTRQLSAFGPAPLTTFNSRSCMKNFLQPIPVQTPAVKTLTKFSLKSGKRKSVKAVLKRFYRLDWGIWIRGKCGRQKKLFRKSAARKRRLRQHVFTNSTQSWLLDTMVTSFWRRPKHYVDDPYQPYHSREEFLYTRRKPYIRSS